MLHKTQNLLLTTLMSVSLYASSVEIGSGKINLQSGILGYDTSLPIDTLTYSLVEHHKNIFSSSWCYSYNLTWYDSDTLVQQQNNFNSLITNIPQNNTIQNLEYRIQGLDANLVLGKDLYHQNENRYFSLGLILGVSLPWVDSKSNSNSSNSSDSKKLLNGLKSSKTSLYTYKIGPTISASYDFNKYLMIYGNASYAYQTGKIKNSYLDSSFTADGTFLSYDIGLKLQPFANDYKTKLMTFKTRLYATLGYRYAKWELDNIDMNSFGSSFNASEIDFNMDTSTIYAGIGYDFF